MAKRTDFFKYFVAVMSLFVAVSVDAAVVKRGTVARAKTTVTRTPVATTKAVENVVTDPQQVVEEVAIAEEPFEFEDKTSQFDSVIGNVASSEVKGDDSALAEMIRKQRAAADASAATGTVKAAVRTSAVSGQNACDMGLRKCMQSKCGADFAKCAGDTDAAWGNKMDACRRDLKCSGAEYAAFAPEIKADRDANAELANYNAIVSCGNRYNSCIVNECGATFSKCLSKSAGDAAIAKCKKIQTECNKMDNGLATRIATVFAGVRQDAEKQILRDEQRLYALRDEMESVCNRVGAMFDTRSLDCVYTINFFADAATTPYASKKAYAGAMFSCEPGWFGIDITTFKENAYRLTRSQTAASSAMMGSGLGLAAGAITSGAIDRALETQKAKKELKEAEEQHEANYGAGKECTAAGGTWNAKRDKCDCGKGKEWNGTACIDEVIKSAEQKRCEEASGSWDEATKTCANADCGDKKIWDSEQNKCVKRLKECTRAQRKAIEHATQTGIKEGTNECIATACECGYDVTDDGKCAKWPAGKPCDAMPGMAANAHMACDDAGVAYCMITRCEPGFRVADDDKSCVVDFKQTLAITNCSNAGGHWESMRNMCIDAKCNGGTWNHQEGKCVTDKEAADKQAAATAAQEEVTQDVKGRAACEPLHGTWDSANNTCICKDSAHDVWDPKSQMCVPKRSAEMQKRFDGCKDSGGKWDESKSECTCPSDTDKSYFSPKDYRCKGVDEAICEDEYNGTWDGVTCKCPNSGVWHDSMCMSAAEKKCSDSGGDYSESGGCLCLDNMVNKDGACVECTGDTPRVLDGRCVSEQEFSCSDSDGTWNHTKKVCICPSDMTLIDDKCKYKLQTQIDCEESGGNWKDNECDCGGREIIDGKCADKSDAQKACEEKPDIAKWNVVAGECRCNISGQDWNGTDCTCPTERPHVYGDKCIAATEYDCVTTGGEMNGGKCNCGDKILNGTKCVEKGAEQKACEAKPGIAKWDAGECKCVISDQLIWNGTDCICPADKPKKYEDKCMTNAEYDCVITDGTMDGDKCNCGEREIIDGKCVDKSAEQKACEKQPNIATWNDTSCVCKETRYTWANNECKCPSDKPHDHEGRCVTDAEYACVTGEGSWTGTTCDCGDGNEWKDDKCQEKKRTPGSCLDYQGKEVLSGSTGNIDWQTVTCPNNAGICTARCNNGTWKTLASSKTIECRKDFTEAGVSGLNAYWLAVGTKDQGYCVNDYICKKAGKKAKIYKLDGSDKKFVKMSKGKVICE